MKQQYKASFLTKGVFDSLIDLKKDTEYTYKLLGLLESLSTFDCFGNVSLEADDEIPSLLAVANNIITRGRPTIGSRYISDRFQELSKDFTAKDFYSALHLIDVRNNETPLFNDDLDSKFEHAFLNNYIPENKKFLVQLFQHQREKRTLTHDGTDHGRVDFSFECPYFEEVEKNTVYNRPKKLKERTTTIIEVDGKRYHNVLIDDLRDYETAKFGHNTKRIHEENAKHDTQNLIDKLCSTDYIQVIQNLLNREQEDVKRLQTLVLTPIGSARIQKVINQFILSNYSSLIDKEKLQIAIFERDVPCGSFAVDDLNLLYQNLIGLEGNGYHIPKIEVTVFRDEDFIPNDVIPQIEGLPKDTLIPEAYDLVIDNSVLWKTGIYKADNDFSNLDNSIILRSSHFTEIECFDSIICAKPIEYRDLTIERGNEQHEEVAEALPYIEYFLQNIFWKERYRKGQLPILNRALKSKTVIGLLPTGGGKSLTYQLAALLQPGITIVIDPIRSLMIDQYEGLLSIGIDKCDFINSILSREEKVFVQGKVLAEGKTQFVFCSPERLVIQEFRDILNTTYTNSYSFTYCVIDEAHCVSEWGHDFRTPYLNLGENAIEYCKTFNNTPIPIFGLTATASFDVLADIERELKLTDQDGNAIVRYENTVRDEINYQIHPIHVDAAQPQQINNQSVGRRKQERVKTIISRLNDENHLILKYNNSEDYSSILRKTHHEFLPVSEQNIPEIEFIENGLGTILLTNSELPFLKDNKGKYNYGVIIFCPHTGKARKNGNPSELGVLTYKDYLVPQLPEDSIVYFIGSGNDENKDQYEKESFENLGKFKNSDVSVMVATKAFGMGIDKSNIRLTVHVNPASSIESFVQESGRAGRDGKLSLSIILYNNQIDRDRQVLESFYKSSFKGADKERTVIWELRNKIFFPNKTNLRLLNDILNEEFNDNLKLTLGGKAKGKDGNPDKDWTDFLFIKDNDDSNIGWINIQSKTATRFANSELANLYLEKIRSFIANFKNQTKEETRNFLQTNADNSVIKDGLEQLLTHDDFDFSNSITIPFKNMFFCKDDKSGFGIVDEFAFEKHFEYLKQSNRIQWLFTNKKISESNLKDKFSGAIKWDNSFEEFVNTLPLSNEADKNILNDDVDLKVKYYIPRNQDDTAKAIHRLTSIGVIDTYTIDYQNKVFEVRISRKDNQEYLSNYQQLVARYTSLEESRKLRELCEREFHETANTTLISTCLKHLTNFVYDKIADKRKRAIDDMIGLCEETIVINDPIEQSLQIKENIYYYFNAKYAREGNLAVDQAGLEVGADLNKDFQEGLSIADTIWKYIENIVDYDDNNAVINNIKHLRGATMRMLRSYEAPQFNILKAYSLYLLSPDAKQLINEAINELKIGIGLWNNSDPTGFDFEKFFVRFKSNLRRHLGELSDEMFGDVDDDYYTSKHLQWIKQFNQRFLKDYKYAHTTSN